MEKQVEEEKKELEKQREQKEQVKLQLRRYKEGSGSERRIAAGIKSEEAEQEEREVEQNRLDNLLEPVKDKSS